MCNIKIISILIHASVLYVETIICSQNANQIRDRAAIFPANINHLVLPISEDLCDPFGFEYDPRHNWFTVYLVYDNIFPVVIALTKFLATYLKALRTQ